MEHLRIPSDGLVLDAVAVGPVDGPVVVLLHGFPQNGQCWRRVWPGLAAAGLRVVVPDLRGTSPDARPSSVQDYVMERLVGDVVAVLDHVGAEQAHLVGHDWGAAMAWHTAGRQQERVSTLTAVSVPHPRAFVQTLMTDPDQQRRSQYMRDWRSADAEKALLAGGLDSVFTGVDGVEADRYLPMLRAGGLTGGLNLYRAQSRADLTALGPITMPTLHVWSDEDHFLGRAGAEATASHVVGPYRFEVLSGVTHWVPEQAAEQLTTLLLEHLLEPG